MHLFAFLQAATATAAAVAQVIPPIQETSLVYHLGSAGLIVWLIQISKRLNFWPFTYITANSDTLNRTISVIAGILVAAGITYSITAAPTGGFLVNVAIPPLAKLTSALMHGSAQMLVQQSFYQGIVKRPSTAAQEVLGVKSMQAPSKDLPTT